ncbi:MAG: flavodoxin family protein [Thermodesulfobacteriota bacterium]
MKVVAVNGSSRKDGNTAILLRTVLSELSRNGIGTELIQLAGNSLKGCTACNQCRENRDCRCVIPTDNFNDYFSVMIAAEGILLGSPVYFTDVTASMKALIERTGRVAKANGGLLRRKAGAAVVAVRRAGAVHTFDTLNHLFLYSEMIVPGSQYWNLGMGGEPGQVESDSEGIEIMRRLGENLAWLMNKIYN